MCTILIGFQVHPLYPLVVAANRDEATARPFVSPHLLSVDPWIFAGRDALAGGTWLGMTRWGLVGLTNFPTQPYGTHTSRSRGLLMLDLLQQTSAEAALAELERQEGVAYESFNIFIAEPTRLWCVYHREGRVRVEALTPGWHVLPNGEVDDRRNHKVGRAFTLLHEAGLLDVGRAPQEVPTGASLVQHLREILADDVLALLPPDRPSWLEPGFRRQLSSLCVHTPHWGTRSYSIHLLGGPTGPEFWYGEGKPCAVGAQRLELVGW